MNDLIYRQDAIDGADEIIKRDTSGNNAVVEAMKAWKVYIGNLPSASQDIIRCKNCKNSEHWYRDKCRCFLWYEDGIGVFEDGFCNYAERKEE